MQETSSYIEFLEYVHVLLRAKGHLVRAAESNQGCHYGRVDQVLRSAVAAGTTSNPQWASALYSYASMSAAIIESLRTVGVFDRMLGDGMRRLPLRTRIAITALGATGTQLEEGAPAILSLLRLQGAMLEPLKAIALLVITDDLIRSDSGSASQLFANELRKALVAITDQIFIAAACVGAPEVASVGSTAADVLIDVGHLIDLVGPKADSRLFLVMDGITGSHLSTKAGSDGRQAFPDMTPTGGSIAGIPALVTDSIEEDSSGRKLVLFDANSIAGDSDIMTVEVSDQATIEMRTDPTNNSVDGTPTTMVSLFQTDSTALKMRRWFGFELLRDNAVAVLSQVSY